MGSATAPPVPKKEERKYSEKDGKRILKTGMIMKKPMQDLSKQGRTDIEEEDNEESYYRWKVCKRKQISNMLLFAPSFIRDHLSLVFSGLTHTPVFLPFKWIFTSSLHIPG